MAVSSMPAPHTHADASGRERDDVRSVVISNLPREATDAWLKLLFDPVAAVERVDFTRGEGPASAVITFRTPEEAQCAVQFDGYVALGNALHVKPLLASTAPSKLPLNTTMANLSRLDMQPQHQVSPLHQHSVALNAAGGVPRFGGAAADAPPTHKNLYVLNLPLDATTDQLTALFSSYGLVVHCVILAMLDAQARRRGFIDMGGPADAKCAIEGLNGFVWHGYPIEVSYAIVQRSGGPFDHGAPGRNVIKRNVPRNRFNTGPRRVPEDPGLDIGGGASSLFMAHNSSYPPSFYGRIGGMNSSGTSSPSEASGGSSGSRGGSISYPGGASNIATDPCTLFISGLDPVAILDDDDLRHALEPYGTITAASLSRDQSGISRGYGVITFSAEHEASRARDGIDGKVINGRRLTAHNLVYQRTPSDVPRVASLPVPLAPTARDVHPAGMTPYMHAFPELSPMSAGAASLLGASPVPAHVRFAAPLPQQLPTASPLPLPAQSYALPPAAGFSSHMGRSPHSGGFTDAAGHRRLDLMPMGSIGAVTPPTESWGARDALRPTGLPEAYSPYATTRSLALGGNEFDGVPLLRTDNVSRPIEIKPDLRASTPQSTQHMASPFHGLGTAFTPANTPVRPGHRGSGASLDLSSSTTALPQQTPPRNVRGNGGSERTPGMSPLDTRREGLQPLSFDSPSQTRTPGAIGGTWGSGAVLGLEDLSPQSTMSTGSTTSRLSTPGVGDPTDSAIWSASPTNSKAFGAGGWYASAPKTLQQTYDSSALQALQQDSPPHTGSKRNTALHPVGHEKSSSLNSSTTHSSSPLRPAFSQAPHEARASKTPELDDIGLDLTALHLSGV